MDLDMVLHPGPEEPEIPPKNGTKFLNHSFGWTRNLQIQSTHGYLYSTNLDSAWCVCKCVIWLAAIDILLKFWDFYTVLKHVPSISDHPLLP